jgi:hypothetical protein
MTGENCPAGYGEDFDSTWKALGLEGAAIGFARQVWAAAVSTEQMNLRDERKRLLAALVTLTELCEHVPVFKLDSGKSSVKAVRRAGEFMAALDGAKAAISKTLHPSYKPGEIGPHGLVPATREEIERHTDRVKRDVVPKIMEEQRRKRGGKP